MMKTKVQTYFHLTDSKGFTKIIEWTSEGPPPMTYRMPKICSLVLQEVKSSFPPQYTQLEYFEFKYETEKIDPINDKFYNVFVYYKEY